jgi:hypothetical protein
VPLCQQHRPSPLLVIDLPQLLFRPRRTGTRELIPVPFPIFKIVLTFYEKHQMTGESGSDPPGLPLAMKKEFNVLRFHCV